MTQRAAWIDELQLRGRIRQFGSELRRQQVAFRRKLISRPIEKRRTKKQQRA
jgi:hypothetical protein